MVTLPQREKEESDDYRYSPDPDLVPLTLDSEWIASIRTALPEVPTQRVARIARDFAIPKEHATALIGDRATADLIDAAADAGGIAERMLDSPLAPTQLAEQLNLLQSSDRDETAEWVAQVLAANQKAVDDGLSNPHKMKAARGFPTGQVMKLSGGKADPRLVHELIESKLTAR